MKKYDTMAEAYRDGWQMWASVLPTTYVYYINAKSHETRREDEMLNSPKDEKKL